MTTLQCTVTTAIPNNKVRTASSNPKQQRTASTGSVARKGDDVDGAADLGPDVERRVIGKDEGAICSIFGSVKSKFIQTFTTQKSSLTNEGKEITNFSKDAWVSSCISCRKAKENRDPEQETRREKHKKEPKTG